MSILPSDQQEPLQQETLQSSLSLVRPQALLLRLLPNPRRHFLDVQLFLQLKSDALYSFAYLIRNSEILDELRMRWFERVRIEILCKGGVKNGLFDSMNNGIVRSIRLEPRGIFFLPKSSCVNSL